MATHSSTDQQGSSRPIACLNCRQRRSYCSKETPTCSRCHKKSLTCSYEETRKITISESCLRELESKAKAYEDAIHKRKRSGASRSRSASDETDGDFGDEHSFLKPFTQLSVNKPSSSFERPGSLDNFLRSVGKLLGFPDDDGSLDVNLNFYHPDALSFRRATSEIPLHLPPYNIALHLFAAQYAYIGTIFAFSEPRNTLNLLTQAYRGPPSLSDKEACLSYAKVLILLAFGQLYSVNQWVDCRGPPGFDYFMAVLSLLPDVHEEGSIACVEVLALVGYFMQSLNNKDAAFLYISMALRMAISLGLHQEVNPGDTTATSQRTILNQTLDEPAREHRRRVWWSVYSLDRILSVQAGNPLAIQDKDIGVALPSRLPEEALYCPAAVLCHYTQLSRILGDIHETIYCWSAKSSPITGNRLMASVQGIIHTLSNWNRNLPDELRFDPASPEFTRESVSTLAHYYQCISMAVRPFLFHVVRKRLKHTRSGQYSQGKERDWKEGLSSSTIKLIDICIGGAKDVVNMMTIAAQKDLVATYGYMDGEHVLSATIVLVMAYVAFPTTPSTTVAMRAGLKLLQTMSERGNSHLSSRYDLLRNMSLSAVPESINVEFSEHMALDFPSALTPQTLNSPGISNQNMFSVGSNSVRASTPATSQAWSSLSNVGGEPLCFPMVDNAALGEVFYDENSSPGVDLRVWEEGFANPSIDPGFDFPQ
ncbi:fungal-specific transcription factor [Dactylonectria estremocensis]|uniref:Fungal-specific transcription factor n=1 Tax=Dactylonectria estremocensis TaxID=1079267 RepID=A0A9P9EJ14_9HYPO|nr:fungal-specific transcription factor [Dactylonectria estremocensis]